MRYQKKSAAGYLVRIAHASSTQSEKVLIKNSTESLKIRKQ
jgi:hypothetical protein